ncbi:MAG: 2Fe-2S iron-sulfur cluster-binding protein [Butyricimonas faecihominis]
MSKINSHPILDVPKRDKVVFTFNGKKIEGEKGFTIAAALHQAGYPVHSHSLDGRGRSLACGIGKCGACEMLVDGKVRTGQSGWSERGTGVRPGGNGRTTCRTPD